MLGSHKVTREGSVRALKRKGLDAASLTIPDLPRPAMS